MANEKETQRIIPPYLSYRTFQNYVEGLKGGVPGRIDRSVLRNFSGIVQSQLLSALQFFGLIDKDGHPTNALELLAQAQLEDKKKQLAEMIRAGYPFVFAGNFNLATATPKLLSEQFEKAGITGDTVRKSVAFFILAAKDAGLPLSKFIKVPRAPRSFGPRQPRLGGKDNGGAEGNGGGNDLPPSHSKSPYQVLIEILEPEKMDEKERDAVWTLLQYLKKREMGRN